MSNYKKIFCDDKLCDFNSKGKCRRNRLFINLIKGDHVVSCRGGDYEVK